MNAVVPDHEVDTAALGWSVTLAGNAPLSVRGNKRVLRELPAAERAAKRPPVWTGR